jgi:hypothetical protein
MDEHLVGYLLGSLDPVTHQRVEVHLRHHPEAQANLDLLRRAVAPLAEDGDPDPPPGLALSALARLAEHRCALPTAPALSRGESATPGRRWFGRAEWGVAAALLVLVGGLALPAIVQARRAANQIACADNLRRFHAGLTAYADANHGDFPQPEPQGPLAIAGIFVPLLNERGLMPEVSVGCPAHGRQKPPSYTLDELAALSRDDPERFESAAAQLAGHYSYCLGYEQNGRLCGLKQTSGDLLPILADNAGHDGANSDNHGARGQNVLYVGGQVRWCVRPTVGVGNDHIYVNQRNRVQAGVRRIDTVLGSSAARPFVAE